MDYSALRLAIADGVARLTLADATRGNPIDGAMCRDLRLASEAILASSEVRTLLIDAEGPVFSYGGDIAAFMAHFDDLPGTIARWVADLNQAIVNLQAAEIPIVALVRGVCAGGMVGLAAGADIVLATPAARFVAAYAGIGISCDGGSSYFVGRRLGSARARRFYLLNQTIKAADALHLGLIDELVDDDVLDARGADVAAGLARGPIAAYREIGRLLASASDKTLAEQLELEAQALVRSMGGGEAREGLLAFSQKRRPDFMAAGHPPRETGEPDR